MYSNAVAGRRKGATTINFELSKNVWNISTLSETFSLKVQILGLKDFYFGNIKEKIFLARIMPTV